MDTNEELIGKENLCQECGRRLPKAKDGALETQKEMKAFACQMLHLCQRCYAERFPERKSHCRPSHRRFQHSRWVDLKPVMSWFRKEPYVREGEAQEIQESRKLLPEEKDE